MDQFSTPNPCRFLSILSSFRGDIARRPPTTPTPMHNLSVVRESVPVLMGGGGERGGGKKLYSAPFYLTFPHFPSQRAWALAEITASVLLVLLLVCNVSVNFTLQDKNKWGLTFTVL
jgi:hypothetical protein